MDLGVSQGGLPPDSLVETIDEILADTERLASSADGAMVQIAVAPCSPFSVTRELMVESAALGAAARPQAAHASCGDRRGGRVLPRDASAAGRPSTSSSSGGSATTSGARTASIFLAADIAAFSAAGVGVAHCPSSNLRLGAGVAPVRELLDAGVHVGLGVDGSASNERGDLFLEVKNALLVARGRGGPKAMTARDAIRLGTRGGAAVLGRDDLGQLAPGKRADFAIWPVDELALQGAADPVAGLVFAGPHRVDRLVVAGERRRARRVARPRRRGRDRARAPSSVGAVPAMTSAERAERVMRTSRRPRADQRGGRAARPPVRDRRARGGGRG